MVTPAIQKSWLRGVCRSNHTVFPFQPHHSWPLISMSIVRWCISRIRLPSVRIVQVRSSSCHVPSWQTDFRDIDDRDPVRGVEHQRVPLGRKGSVVKIERGTAGVAGQSNHSMPGVGIEGVAFLTCPVSPM